MNGILKLNILQDILMAINHMGKVFWENGNGEAFELYNSDTVLCVLFVSVCIYLDCSL